MIAVMGGPLPVVTSGVCVCEEWEAVRGGVRVCLVWGLRF